MLVLGRGDTLDALHQIPVIPLTTQSRGLSWEVRLSERDGLPSVCVLKPEWIRAVERDAIGPWITRLPDDRWGEVRRALLQALGFSNDVEV